MINIYSFVSFEARYYSVELEWRVKELTIFWQNKTIVLVIGLRVGCNC